jgi:hypothetical protein
MDERNSVMNFFLLTVLFFTPYSLFAEVRAKKTIYEPMHPIERPPLRPVVPITVNPGVVYQDNYYNYNYNRIEVNCRQYADLLREKDRKIEKLTKEVLRLQSQADKRLQKELRAQHQKELQEFDNRKSTVKTTNSIEITDK